MPHRVLLLVYSLARAGTEHNVALTCKYLDQQQFQPEVWVCERGGSLESIVTAVGVEIRELRRGWKYNLWNALKAARQIARSKVDLVHVYLPSVAVYAALAKLLYRMPQPMVFRCGWCHDLGFAARWRYKWLYGSAFDAFVANSESAADFLESMGIERRRIRLIPNIHEQEQFQRPVDRRQVRNALGVDADAPLLIHVGRFATSKRVEDLIEAVHLLAPKYPELRLLLVGDGPERPIIEQCIRESNLTRQIILLGVRDDIPALLKSSDLFVFPSEIEGSPNAVIEACLAEVPIVACDVLGVRDVVQHRATALLAPPRNPRAFADCIEESLSDRSAARQRARAARLQAESVYRVENVLSRLYELYEGLLAGKPMDAQSEPTATPA
jgi:glycosyltransferase involved in cell wall biosynthesis